MDPLIQVLIAALVSFLTASTGFWAYLKNRKQLNDDERACLAGLLMGLTQIRITELGMRYIERGWVTEDEYRSIRRYLYEPYVKLGGNGAIERIMHAVERLPFRSEDPVTETVFRDIPIRETDRTGLPHDKNYRGEERRGKRT